MWLQLISKFAEKIDVIDEVEGTLKGHIFQILHRTVQTISNINSWSTFFARALRA